MERTKSEKSVCTELCRRTVSYGGMLLEYRLIAEHGEGGTEYVLTVLCGSEKFEGRLGEDLHTALRYFDVMADGLVTPCSAEDVLEDLIYLSKSGGKF